MLILALIAALWIPQSSHALNKSSLAMLPATLSARGVAVLGWKNGTYTPLALKNAGNLYPIASITKLPVAAVAEDLYKEEEIFTVSENAEAARGNAGGLQAGQKISRYDILKALLVESSNDASIVLEEYAKPGELLTLVNEYLDQYEYAHTPFINTHGLDNIDPKQTPNSMSALSSSLMVQAIYQEKETLRSILHETEPVIYDASRKSIKQLRNTNPLLFDDLYAPRILASKTGTTKKAGQNIILVTEGNDEFDYFTVVLLGSKDRTSEARNVLNILYTP